MKYFFMMSIWFIMNDLIYFLLRELLSLNSTNIVMTFLIDWMSLLLMSFVLMISSLVFIMVKNM